MLLNVLSVTAQNILRMNVLKFGDLLRMIRQMLFLKLTLLDPRKFGYQRKFEISFWLWVIIERKSKWYLDIGCSRHMTGNSSSFMKLEKQKWGNVSFGGNNKGNIIGHGVVKIGSLIINNVSLVKGLNYNLSSISLWYKIQNQFSRRCLL